LVPTSLQQDEEDTDDLALMLAEHGLIDEHSPALISVQEILATIVLACRTALNPRLSILNSQHPLSSQLRRIASVMRDAPSVTSIMIMC